MSKKIITRKCPICNSVIKNKSSKYCSRKCYYVARKQGLYKPYWLGKHRSKETNKKISLANKGKKPWCTGKKLTEKHKKNLSISHQGIYVGDKHPNWKGGRHVDERGYIRVWIASKKWRYEHNLVMEKHLGRKLKKGEVVHHINQNKSDNRITNLMLFPNTSAHMKYHIYVLKMKIKNQYSK